MDDTRVDVINQVFSLFRINYHNQFYAAYADSDTLNQAKRLWLQSLAPFQNETLLVATRDVIEQSEYLPTLHRFIESCDRIELALPTAREAYLEACLARQPHTHAQWSHPLVYFAAKTTGWHFLRSQQENKALPVFRENFNALARELRTGKIFKLPALTQDSKQDTGKKSALSIEQRQEKLKKLKDDLALS
ncbi:MAG: replication protein P [Pseudomonadales bacterium]